MIKITTETKPVLLSNERKTIELTIGNRSVNFISGGTHLEKEFTFEDFPGGSIKIGNCLSGLRIDKVSVIVNEDDEFDDGTMVIGDANAHGRLMVAADIDLTRSKKYSVEPDESYEEDTDLYAYFESGTPTQGTGLIIIYLQ